MRLEDIPQPTEKVTQNCPGCSRTVTMVPYDIGSGPEMSCPHCEWCWGANDQDLKPVSWPAVPVKLETPDDA